MAPIAFATVCLGCTVMYVIRLDLQQTQQRYLCAKIYSFCIYQGFMVWGFRLKRQCLELRDEGLEFGAEGSGGHGRHGVHGFRHHLFGVEGAWLTV